MMSTSELPNPLELAKQIEKERPKAMSHANIMNQSSNVWLRTMANRLMSLPTTNNVVIARVEIVTIKTDSPREATPVKARVSAIEMCVSFAACVVFGLKSLSFAVCDL